jgi:predicted nucleic acid-binding protein
MSPKGKVVVDTNVFSYMHAESPLGLQYRALLYDYELCIAFVTPEECYYGAERKGWGERRRQALEKQVSYYVLLPTNLEIARISGRIRAARDRCGRPLSPPDSWIAATALWYGVPAASHDADLRGIEGLLVITCEADTLAHRPDSEMPTAHEVIYEAMSPAYFCGHSGAV